MKERGGVCGDGKTLACLKPRQSRREMEREEGVP